MREFTENRRTAAHPENRTGRAYVVKKARIDYRTYQLNMQEKIRYFLIYLGLDGMVSFLFYRSWFPFLLGIPGAAVYLKQQEKALAKKRQKRLEEEFLMGMRTVSSSLAAGYSVENAFSEGLQQTWKLYGEEGLITMEFAHIERMLGLNETLEALLLDLGERSGVEDIQGFGEVFAVAKRTGGDLNAIIRNTVSIIAQKTEVQQEIDVCLASKKMEQTIMSGIPFFILGYVGLTSPEFLIGLYHTAAGVLIMTVCLMLYLAAFFLGRYFVKIEV